MNGVSITRKVATGFAGLFLSFFLFGSLAQAANFAVTNLSDSEGSGSLRWAIGQADATSAEDLITFDSNLTGTISLTQDLSGISNPVEIRGPGMDKVKVDGKDQYTLFVFHSSSAKISGLTLANGDFDFGGAVRSAADLELDGVRMTGSNGKLEGGAIHIDPPGSLTMTDSEVIGNSASQGGGIWAGPDTNLTITDSKIADNTATSTPFGGGGGIWVTGGSGSLNLSGTEISENSAPNQGGIGVLHNMDGDGEVTISGSKITDNSATSVHESALGGGGGAIVTGNTTITDTEISGNSSNSSIGGLILIGKATITSSLIADNDAAGSVGGLSLSGGMTPGKFTVTNSTITGNVSGLYGGGIACGVSQLKIESSTITDNTVTFPSSPTYGGAGVFQAAGNAELVNSIVSGNSPADIAPVTTLPGPPPPAPLPPGTIKGSFSLVGTASEGSLTTTVSGSNISSTDPKLGPLADNGGKLRTMLPAEDSAVIDQGLSTLPTDQRGLARPVDFDSIPNSTGGNGADIGAVEVQPATVDPDPPTPPSNQFSFGWYKVNKKTGVASLQIVVPGKGRLLVLGSKTVAKSSATAKGASTVVVKVKAKGKAAKTLRKKGKAKVKAKIKFTPTGGKARTKAKNIKLAKAKKKKR